MRVIKFMENSLKNRQKRVSDRLRRHKLRQEVVQDCVFFLKPRVEVLN